MLLNINMPQRPLSNVAEAMAREEEEGEMTRRRGNSGWEERRTAASCRNG